jgi:hypothetical protein
MGYFLSMTRRLSGQVTVTASVLLLAAGVAAAPDFFESTDTSPGITPEPAKAQCFDACHKAQEARDFVFSDPRR